MDAPALARRGPGRLRVVAPDRQTPAARRFEVGDEGPQILALVRAGLLALNTGQPHIPRVKDQACELAFLRRHDQRAFRLAHDTSQLIEPTIGNVLAEP